MLAVVDQVAACNKSQVSHVNCSTGSQLRLVHGASNLRLKTLKIGDSANRKS